MPTKNKIIVPCAQCGKGKERTQSQIKNAKNNFCNAQCKGAWLKAHPRNRITVQCSFCDKPIERTAYYIKKLAHHFCDKQCNAEWLKTQTGSLSAHYNSITVQCEMCGKDIQKPPGRIKRNKHHFCGQKCKYAYKATMTGSAHPLWKGGAISYYGPNWYAQNKAALKRDNYHCQVCGMEQWGNEMALDVHHIIPFRKFNYIPDENENYLQANALDNLVSLCRSCHAKVEFGTISLPSR